MCKFNDEFDLLKCQGCKYCDVVVAGPDLLRVSCQLVSSPEYFQPAED